MDDVLYFQILKIKRGENYLFEYNYKDRQQKSDNLFNFYSISINHLFAET